MSDVKTRQPEAEAGPAALQKAGFQVHEGRVTIPNHAGFDLSKSIIRSIVRQAGLSIEEFLALLEK